MKYSKSLGVYIHIPFCKQKCLYCDFVSYAKKEYLQNKYIQALKKEIKNWKEQCIDVEVSTIYIGGGTPSYIESKNIIDVLSQINLPDLNKNSLKKSNFTGNITIEVNPRTVTKQKLIDYKNAGIDRLSIGLQSIDNDILKEIGRIHTCHDFIETYNLARCVGFKNINVDLMIGLPNQTIQDIKRTMEFLLELKPCEPEHISVYSLIIEENTPMKKMLEEKKISLPDEDKERNMYWYVKDFLELHGYKHYEISNFAKQGFESKHNMDCWSQKEYIGFGANAHSYINNKRFYNIANLEKYIENIENGNFEKNIIVDEVQDRIGKMKEFVLIGLRKLDGISIQEFKNKFNENPIVLFKNELNKLNDEELIEIDGDMIRLSNKGIDFANLVWEEFV